MAGVAPPLACFARRATQGLVDIVYGRSPGVPVETLKGVRFPTRSRVFTDEEAAKLKAAGPPACALNQGVYP